MTAPYSTVCVCVCLFAAHYEVLATTCQNRYQVDGPTGLLLVYPLHCIHIIEVSPHPGEAGMPSLVGGVSPLPLAPGDT